MDGDLWYIVLGVALGVNARAYTETMQDFTNGSYQNFRDFINYEKDQRKSHDKWERVKETIKIPGRHIAYQTIKNRDKKRNQL
jgi:hypothetical protein